ncbi:hypothetical protein QTP70_013588 [Hemibagrus guttatus]|uniref:Uncharacterized protein n=1 Tax=Hemibagrus guttatus TaxID=175788 RepID=A0AAE0QVF5_9TELE|nr:hypothetical protein QTP70_013588 [Hemibagrus guttatus]
MGKRKDLSEFNKGQIVMARRLDQGISKTAGIVECSRSAVYFMEHHCVCNFQPVHEKMAAVVMEEVVSHVYDVFVLTVHPMPNPSLSLGPPLPEYVRIGVPSV